MLAARISIITAFAFSVSQIQRKSAIIQCVTDVATLSPAEATEPAIRLAKPRYFTERRARVLMGALLLANSELVV